MNRSTGKPYFIGPFWLILGVQKDYSWNPYTCISENNKYLRSIADTSSVNACDEIISVIDIVWTKKTNAIAKNVSIICYSDKI